MVGFQSCRAYRRCSNSTYCVGITLSCISVILPMCMHSFLRTYVRVSEQACVNVYVCFACISLQITEFPPESPVPLRVGFLWIGTYDSEFANNVITVLEPMGEDSRIQMFWLALNEQNAEVRSEKNAIWKMRFEMQISADCNLERAFADCGGEV